MVRGDSSAVGGAEALIAPAPVASIVESQMAAQLQTRKGMTKRRACDTPTAQRKSNCEHHATAHCEQRCTRPPPLLRSHPSTLVCLDGMESAIASGGAVLTRW